MYIHIYKETLTDQIHTRRHILLIYVPKGKTDKSHTNGQIGRQAEDLKQ